MNKIKFTLLAVAVALGVVSCNDNDYEYVAAAQNSGENNIGFDSEENFLLALSDSKLAVTLSRSNAGDAVTIPVTVVTAPDFIKVPESVSFEAGSKTATLMLAIGEGMVPYNTYRVSLSIPEQYSDVYGEDPKPLVFNALISKEDFSVVANGIFTSTVALTGSWEQPLEYSEYLDLYRLPSLIADGYHYYFHFSVDEKGKQSFYFTDADGNEATVFETGYVHSSYGMITSTINTSVDKGYFEGYEDGQFEMYFFWAWKMTVSAGSFGEKYQYYDVTEWIKKPWETK